MKNLLNIFVKKDFLVFGINVMDHEKLLYPSKIKGYLVMKKVGKV